MHFAAVVIVLVPPPNLGIPSYTVPEDTPSGSQEVCVMIQGAPANVLQRPVTVNLVSSDGPAGVGGAQSKFVSHVMYICHHFGMQVLQTLALSMHQSSTIRDKRVSKCADRFPSLMTSSVKEMSYSMLVSPPLILVYFFSLSHPLEQSQSLMMMVRLPI